MNPHTKQVPTPKFGSEGQAHASRFGAKSTSACYGVGVKKEFLTYNPSQTKKLGEKIAKEIIEKPFRKTAFIIGLEGELGGGKTTFLQGFARGLGIEEKILSPTFVIMRKFFIYPVIRPGSPSDEGIRAKGRYLCHIDCYRIKKPKELLDLGFKEIISNPKNIVVIEWADQIKKIMPKNSIWIEFKFIDENTREIMVKNF